MSSSYPCASLGLGLCLCAGFTCEGTRLGRGYLALQPISLVITQSQGDTASTGACVQQADGFTRGIRWGDFRERETRGALTFQKVGCQLEGSPEEAAMAASDKMLTMLRYRMGTARLSKRMTASSSTQRHALNWSIGVLGHTYTIAVHISSYLQGHIITYGMRRKSQQSATAAKIPLIRHISLGHATQACSHTGGEATQVPASDPGYEPPYNPATLS